MVKLQPNLPPIPCVLGPLRPVFGPEPVLQAHLCLQVLQNSLAQYPQIRQSKQRDQLRRVLGQAPVAHLGVAELALDHPKWMLDLGAHAGLELFGLLEQGSPARVGVDANVRLHPDVPLIALLGLVNLRVTLTVFVLGRAGRGNQCGVHHRACLEQQALVGQGRVDGGHGLKAQIVLFEQMAKQQGGALFRQPAHARVRTGELASQRHVVQGLLHGRIAQAKPLLHEMNAQHGLHRKGRPTCLARRRVRLNPTDQIRPRHHRIHLGKKFTLALGGQLEAGGGKALLFHHCLPHALSFG